MQHADLTPMTDEQISQMALEDWLRVLSRLWRAYDKQIDPDRFGLYRDTLKQVPLGLLELAIDRVIREHRYNTVPTVADVWAAVRKELHNPYDLDGAIDQWCEAIWHETPAAEMEPA